MHILSRTAIAVLFTSALFVPAAHAQQAYEVPKFNVGDRWVYKFVDNWTNAETGRRTEIVAEILEDGVGLSMNSCANWYKGELSKEGLLRKNGAGSTTPHDARVVFPAKAGARANLENTFSRSGVVSGRAQNDIKFDRFEKLTLNVLELETAKFDVAGRWFSGSDSGNFSDQNWYSPAAGRVVKHLHKGYTSGAQLRDQTGFELVEFRRCSPLQAASPAELTGVYKFLIEDDTKTRVLRLESQKEAAGSAGVNAEYGIEGGSMSAARVEFVPNSSTVVVFPSSGSQVRLTVQSAGAVCGTFEYPKKGRTVGIAGNFVRP